MHTRGSCSASVGSHEALLHKVGLPAYALDLRNAPKPLVTALEHSRLQRSIGVIYCNTDADKVPDHLGQLSTGLCIALT